MRRVRWPALFALLVVLLAASVSEPVSAAAAAVIGPPDTVSAEAAQNSVRVSWTAPSESGGSPISSYRVQIVNQRTGVITAQQVGPSVREVTFTGLPEGVTWSATVFDTNSAGRTSRGDSEPYGPGEHQGGPRTEAGRRLAADAPANGLRLCGRMPQGATTLTAAQGPVRLCRAGVLVPAGSALVFDGSAGPVAVLASGAGGIYVTDGSVRTANTTASSPVTFGSYDPQQRWGGIFDVSNGAGGVRLAHAVVQHAKHGIEVQGPASDVALSDVSLVNVSGPTVDVSGASVLLSAVTVAGSDRGVRLGCGGVTPACRFDVESLSVDGAVGTALTVVGGDAQIHTVSLTGTRSLTGNHGREPAAVLSRLTLDASSGPPITDVQGTGGGLDVALVTNSTIVGGSLTWSTLTVPSGSGLHALGWVANGIVVAPRAALVVPTGVMAFLSQGQEVPGEGLFGIVVQNGAALTTRAGAELTSASAPGLPFDLCSAQFSGSCTPALHEWPGIGLQGSAAVTLEHTSVSYASTVLTDYLVQGAAGSQVTVTGSDLGHGGRGLELVRGSADLIVVDTTVHDLTGLALQLVQPKQVAVTGSTFTDTGQLRLQAAPTSAVTLTQDALERTGGLVLSGAEHPSVRQITANNTPMSHSPGPLVRPIELSGVTASYGPGQDIDGLTGSGNALDAVGISGTLTNNLVWVSPHNSQRNSPFGYVLGDGSLGLGPGASLVWPANAVIKADPQGQVTADTGVLDATAGGAVFTSTADSTVGPVTCRVGCTDAWGGLYAKVLRMRQATIHGGQLVGRGDQQSATPDGGSLQLDTITSDSAVFSYDAYDATVTSSRVGSLSVSGTWHADIEHVTATQHIKVRQTDDRLMNGRPRSTDLTLRHDIVTGGTGPGFQLTDVTTTVGPGQRVDDLQGASASDTLQLDGATVDNDLTWVTPSGSGDLHPVGYTVGTGGVSVGMGKTLTVPPAGLVGGTIFVTGSTLLAGKGAAITGSIRTSVGSSPNAIHLDGVTVGGDLFTTDDSGSPTVDISGSQLQSLILGPGSVSIVGSRLRGIAAQRTDVTLNDSEVTGAYSGPALSGSPQQVQISGGSLHATRDTLSLDVPPEIPGLAVAVALRAGAAGTLSCLDVRHNGGGISLDSLSSLSMTDSTVTDNAAPSTPVPGGSPFTRYDLDDAAAVTTNNVWWGQPSGPVAGQVSHLENLTDTAPAGSGPPCAGGSPTAPPVAASHVHATVAKTTARVSWTPSPDPRVTSYLVQAVPGGQQVTVPASTTSIDLGGLRVGQAQRFVVSAVSADATLPSPPSVAVVPVNAGPDTTDLRVPAVVAAPTASAATATVTAPVGSTVTVTATQTGSTSGTTAVSGTAVANEAATATVHLDVSRLPDGPLSWSATATDFHGSTGAKATASDALSTAPPKVTGSLPATAALEQQHVHLILDTSPYAVILAGPVTTTLVADGAGHVDVLVPVASHYPLSVTDQFGNGPTVLDLPGPVVGTPYGREVDVQSVVDRTQAAAVAIRGYATSPGAYTLIAQSAAGQGVSKAITAGTGGYFASTLDLRSLPDGPVTVRISPFYNYVGSTFWANPQTFRGSGAATLDLRDGPLAPTNVRVSRVSGGYDVSWSAPPADPLHPVSGYGLAVAPDPGSVRLSGTTAHVRDIPAGKQETVTIVARSSDVPGAPARVLVTLLVPRVTLAAPASGPAVKPLVVTGVVTPVLAGRRVTLSVQVPGGWRGIGTGTTDVSGHYRISVRPARGQYRLRTSVPPSVGATAGYSPVLPIRRS